MEKVKSEDRLLESIIAGAQKVINGKDELNFPSVTIAEDRIGLSRGAINGAIKRNGTAKGYKFEYNDDRLKVEHFI